MSVDHKQIARTLASASGLEEDDIDDLVLFINEDMELAKCIAERAKRPDRLTTNFFRKALLSKQKSESKQHHHFLSSCFPSINSPVYVPFFQPLSQLPIGLVMQVGLIFIATFPFSSLTFCGLIFNVDRIVRFDVQQQIKISAWQSLVCHLISITMQTTLLDLHRTIRNIFDVEDLPAGKFRVYALNPGDFIGSRRKVDSEAKFSALKTVYLNGDPKVAPPSLFVWSTEKSDASPQKLPTMC